MANPFPMDREEKRVYDLDIIYEEIDKGGGFARTAAIIDRGVDYRRINYFVDHGQLRRIKSGYYTYPNEKYTEEQLVPSLFPDGVLTMESALYYHGYLKERPYGWSIAISKNVSKSRFKLEYPVVEPYYTEPAVLEMGREEIEIAGHTMGIYSKDRLACDLLKYEEKISRELFRQGLLAYIGDETKDIAALMDFAAKRKVTSRVRAVIGVWL